MEYNEEKILNELQHSFLFNGMSFYEERNKEFIDSMGEDFFKNWTFAYGASKFVLIPKDETINFVIKIPYTGTLSIEEEDEDYVDYYYADCDERPWDYCGGEESRYQLAIDEGLDECFAATEYIGEVRGYPIYKQEKCITFSSYPHSHSLEENKKTSKICGYCNISLNWLTDFKLYYGEDKLIHFVDFIRTMNWDDDLRNENIGYLNGRPVLIDYSGFLELQQEDYQLQYLEKEK